MGPTAWPWVRRVPPGPSLVEPPRRPAAVGPGVGLGVWTQARARASPSDRAARRSRCRTPRRALVSSGWRWTDRWFDENDSPIAGRSGPLASCFLSAPLGHYITVTASWPVASQWQSPRVHHTGGASDGPGPGPARHGAAAPVLDLLARVASSFRVFTLNLKNVYGLDCSVRGLKLETLHH